jgi:hypothetical protein
MAVEFFTGFEPGLNVASGDWYDTSATPPSISTSTVRNGARSMRFPLTGARWVRRRFATPPATASYVFYIRFDAVDPSFTVGVFDVSNSAQSKNVNVLAVTDAGSNLSLKIRIYDGVSTFDTTPVSGFLQDTSYRVELKYDWSGAAWKVTWGTAAGDASLTTHDTDFTGGNAAGAGTQDYVLLGSSGTGFLTDFYIDDFAMSNSGSDFPIGPSKVMPFVPDARGTHNLDASPSSFWFQHDGVTPTALTTAESTSYSRIDDAPLLGSTDYLYGTGTPGGTQYAEYTFPPGSGIPDAVRVIESVRQATAGGSHYTSKITDDGGVSLTTIQSALDPNSASEVTKQAVALSKPSGGAWTSAAFDALAYRWGLTADATPEIRLYAVMLEVLYPVEASASGGMTLLGVH